MAKDESLPVDKPLEEWLGAQDKVLFPDSADYPARYRAVADYLSRNVHSEVDRAAMLREIIRRGIVRPEAIPYLTHHGSGHVKHVIARANDLVQASACKMSPYEAYLLLMAIQLHDAGMVFGRKDHEKRCWDVFDNLGDAVGDDHPEKATIVQMAAAHTGTVDGDRDTLRVLEPQVSILGKQVRKRFLAAVLRMADELADDRTRAARFLLKRKRLPAGSQAFHAYSYALHSVIIQGRDVALSFELPVEWALRKQKRLDKEVFLLDEIYDRVLKMHVERLYCGRCLGDSIPLQTITVKIEIWSKKAATPFDTIDFRLEDKGYPDSPDGGIGDLCPDLRVKDGAALQRQLKKKRRHRT